MKKEEQNDLTKFVKKQGEPEEPWIWEWNGKGELYKKTVVMREARKK